VREHAMLVVLIISANDDASDLPIEQIATTLVEAKQDSSMVSVGVLAGPCRQELPLFGADGARRLRTFAAQFPNRNTVTTLCQQDLSGGLQLVSGLPDRPVNNPCLDVELADPPVCAMSLRILDEDQLVPACDRDPSGLCWRIRLDESQCPAAFHQRIVVEHYEPSALRAHVTMECAVPGHDML
jgi:hypothetical protein